MVTISTKMSLELDGSWQAISISLRSLKLKGWFKRKAKKITPNLRNKWTQLLRWSPWEWSESQRYSCSPQLLTSGCLGWCSPRRSCQWSWLSRRSYSKIFPSWSRQNIAGSLVVGMCHQSHSWNWSLYQRFLNIKILIIQMTLLIV